MRDSIRNIVELLDVDEVPIMIIFNLLAQGVLIVLKLLGSSWPWPWILAPLWVLFGQLLATLICGFIAEHEHL